MIPQHRQAIAMAQAHASSQAVRALAGKVKGAQAPEIATMTAWLGSWAEQVPEGMNGVGNESASAMPGMMSNHDMDQLRRTSGRACDTMFLTMMIKHHESAVEVANTQKQQGTYGSELVGAARCGGGPAEGCRPSRVSRCSGSGDGLGMDA